MIRENKLRILTYAVIAYMLLAFAWWSILLFQKNQDAFKAKVELQQLIMIGKGEVNSSQEFLSSSAYLDLEKKYKRQEWMIFGEAIVFVISLVIGVWLINRGYNKAIHTAKQSRNFLLSITHELKSPIASILLTLETFKKRKLDPEKFGKLNNNALVETERLNKLVSDLLLASRMETAYEPRIESFDLPLLIESIIEKIKNKNPQTEIQFLNLNSEENFVVMDVLGMTSIAINLIENAVKYSFDNQKIKVSLNRESDQIIFSVSDQGIGIKAKDRKQIFDRFYRVGDEDTRKTKGTGLGLYIVKKIVERNEGKIRVENNQPKGSVFIVTLPIEVI